MTTKIFTLVVAALLISSISFAKIFRVGYSGPSLGGIDFRDATDAIAAASANDTIQIYPGNFTAGVLSKKLVFIGMGYFLDKNTGLQVATTTANLSVLMDTGASGSTFEGIQITPGSSQGFTLDGEGVPMVGTLQNIMFKRCIFSSPLNNDLYLFLVAGGSNDSVTNIKFSQCFFSSDRFINVTVTNNSGINGLDFQNCIFNFSGDQFSAHIGYPDFSSSTGGTITNISFENCNMDSYGEQQGGDGSVSCYFRNCIIKYEPNLVNNDVFDYCIFESDNPPHNVTGTSNIYGKLFTTIFQGDLTQGTQWDSSYILKSGSPAIGYGRDFSNNPINAGAFGSVNPYKLSGVPDVPAFYKLTAPGSAATANPYTITFSVRANN